MITKTLLPQQRQRSHMLESSNGSRFKTLFDTSLIVAAVETSLLSESKQKISNSGSSTVAAAGAVAQQYRAAGRCVVIKTRFSCVVARSCPGVTVLHCGCDGIKRYSP